MDRDAALKMVQRHVKNRNLIKHMLATEAVMAALARRLGEDAERWGLVGLVHDVDYDTTADDPERHGREAAVILREAGLAEDMLHAVLAHAGHAPRLAPLDTALYATDPLTGLVVAACLVHPERKLAAIDGAFVLNRFQEKSFARGANREAMEECAALGLELDEFVTLGVGAMQAIAPDLGL